MTFCSRIVLQKIFRTAAEYAMSIDGHRLNELEQMIRVCSRFFSVNGDRAHDDYFICMLLIKILNANGGRNHSDRQSCEIQKNLSYAGSSMDLFHYPLFFMGKQV